LIIPIIGGAVTSTAVDTGASALQARELRKSFGGIPVLRGVSLALRPGTVTALAGENGAGKSTLMKIVSGQLRQDAGEVLVDGEQLRRADPRDARALGVGIVPQEGALFPHLSVGANVGFGLNRHARRSGRVEQMLELVGLGGYQRRMPHELSGGQQQRVALARALAPRPAHLRHVAPV
jgi:iron(III) transport system ATP-binding protein